MGHAVVQSDSCGTRCFTGTVTLTNTGLLGATVGTIDVNGIPLPIRQVPGPSNSGIPLSQVDGMIVTVCGNFIVDASGTTFNVTFASVPRFFR